MSERVVTNNGEEFVIALAEDGKSATVTDETGFVVTVSYTRGARPFNTRTPDGLGDSKETIESAVAYALYLCMQARTFMKLEEFSQTLNDYLAGK